MPSSGCRSSKTLQGINGIQQFEAEAGALILVPSHRFCQLRRGAITQDERERPRIAVGAGHGVAPRYSL